MTGDFVKKLRERHGLPQRQLAITLRQVNPRTVIRYESTGNIAAMTDMATLENIAAKARWLRSCEKRYAVASGRDAIGEMNDLGRQVEEAKYALDRALQQSDV